MTQDQPQASMLLKNALKIPDGSARKVLLGKMIREFFLELKRLKIRNGYQELAIT